MIYLKYLTKDDETSIKNKHSKIKGKMFDFLRDVVKMKKNLNYLFI